MMDHIKGALQQLEAVGKLRDTIGRALSNDQQVDISKIIAKDKGAFIDWALTDAGRRSIQDLADKFITAKA